MYREGSAVIGENSVTKNSGIANDQSLSQANEFISLFQFFQAILSSPLPDLRPGQLNREILI
jgi:hypothetical protein